MALRILTGIVNIGNGPRNGRVRIGFNPHRRINGDATLTERRTIGAAGDFLAVPGKHVALRQITIISGLGNPEFIVNDGINRNRLSIRWRGKRGAFSEEISYLVIGEVADPAPPQPIPRPRRRRRRKA